MTKVILTYFIFFAFGALVASAAMADSSYEQSEQYQTIKQANESLKRIRGES